MRLPALFTLIAICAPLEALADPTSEAKAKIERAALAHQEGRFADARAELEAAYAIDPQPQLLYALGQVHVKLGQCGEAIVFYERFLATTPAPDAAESAVQAINACKVAEAQLAARAKQAADVEPPPAEPVLEDLDREETPDELATQPSQLPVQPEGPRSFHTDPIQLALVGGGVASLIAGAVFYRSARHGLEDAEAAPSYEEAERIDDDARGKHRLSIVFTAAGAGLIGGAVYYYVRTRRSAERPGVALVPTHDGGIVSWSGRF